MSTNHETAVPFIHEPIEGGADVAAQQAAIEQNNLITTAPEAEAQAAREQAYATVTGLIDGGNALDGPTLTKAGLGFEDRIKLGYTGSIDKLVEDAQGWKAEKDAKEATEARHAESAAKAAAWRAELDEAKAKRAAAKARVEAHQDGSAVVDGLSYKERLERGGQNGMDRLQEQSKMNREDAVALAGEEGFDVSDYAPKLYEMTTNPEAEKRNADQAEYVRNFWKSVTEAHLDREPDSDEAAQADQPDSVPEATPDTADDTAVIIDAADGAGRTEKGVKSIFGRVREAVGALKWGATEKAWKALSGTARENGRHEAEQASWSQVARRAAVSVVAGTALVFIAKESGLLHDVNHLFGHGGGGDVAAHARSVGGGDHATTLLTGDTPSAPVGTSGGEQVTSIVNLHQGDTVWSEVQHAAPHATEAQISQVVDHTLRLNHLSADDARHLAIGTHIQLPMEEIEKLNAAA